MSNTRIPLYVFAQIGEDTPHCKEHNNKLGFMRNGPPSGYQCYSTECECVVDAMEYIVSTEFLIRAVERLVQENQMLKEQIDDMKEGDR